MQLSKDLLYILSVFVSPSDLVALGSTCKTLQHVILQNDTFWKVLVTSALPSDLWQFAQLDDGQARRLYIKTHNNHNALQLFLKKNFLLHRLAQPQSSKMHLKLYCTIETNTLPTPESRRVILIGELFQDDDDNRRLRFQFKRSKGESFLVWRGEDGHNSQYSYYALDRLRPGPTIPVIPIDRMRNKSSILGKYDYKRIGLLLHNDEHHYEGMASTGYKFDDSHSQTRRLGGGDRFGSNATSVTYPTIAVNAYTHADVLFDIDELFGLFRTPEKI
jgi:hypothetical protein